MDMSAFLAKLKELKMKMAELENMEEQLPDDQQSAADKAEGPEMESLEEKIGVDKPEPVSGVSEEDGEGKLSDDELMDMMGKKKKPMPKAGMKIAIAVGKPKGMSMFGKHK